VEVLLPETPTSGYRWDLHDVPAGVRLLDKSFQHPRATLVAGAQGTRRFVLDIPRTGAYELVFDLARPWEPEPIEVRTVTITVEPASGGTVED
jgi:predicted secreted protein